MPLYEYRGTGPGGKSLRGTIDAENERTARVKFKKEGVFLQSLRNRQKSIKKANASNTNLQRKVSVEDMALMTRQLATLLKANIPLVECLSGVSEQLENPQLKAVMTDIRDQVNEGSSFHKALNKYPKVFNTIYISMAEAGEASGTLDVILMRLAEFTESQNELRQKVTSSMMYPVLMMVFTLGVLLILFIFLIPKITAIFDQFPELVLPWYSKMIIDLSDFLIEYWLFLFIAVTSMIAMFLRWKATPNGSAQWDTILLKLPVIGKMTRMIAVSRFTRTLSTLLTGGVPMLQSMDIVKNVVSNHVLEKAITASRDNISEGENISGPLKKSGEFPPLVIHMINIGEKTGELEVMLTQVSDAYDFQVRNSVEGLTSILQPVMIVFMGIVVGIIVLAIMVPIFQLQNIAQ
ncbi:MAG: type II secretion system inner membrane protein GspF [Bdellovibrionales bacterium]|nr:type II secretion system inner membrane protein GspF [Bdellovibrionales bacterium]